MEVVDSTSTTLHDRIETTLNEEKEENAAVTIDLSSQYRTWTCVGYFMVLYLQIILQDR